MSDLEEIILQEQEKAFEAINTILFSMGNEHPQIDAYKRSEMIFDVVEQLMARAISGASVSEETMETVYQHSIDNIYEMAQHFLKEELDSPSATQQ